MQIEIIQVTVNTIPTAKGSYQKAEVAYKRDGKVEGRQIMSFVNKEVFNTVVKAKAGEVYEVKLEKDAKDYWQWVSIQTGGSVEASNSSNAGNNGNGMGKSVRSTYETPEERAIKQVYIVRQSSISNALTFTLSGKDKHSIEDVLKIAKMFEGYVFGGTSGGTTSDGGLAAMEDDVPL
jgi:hypothetical protein